MHLRISLYRRPTFLQNRDVIRAFITYVLLVIATVPALLDRWHQVVSLTLLLQWPAWITDGDDW